MEDVSRNVSSFLLFTSSVAVDAATSSPPMASAADVSLPLLLIFFNFRHLSMVVLKVFRSVPIPVLQILTDSSQCESLTSIFKIVPFVQFQTMVFTEQHLHYSHDGIILATNCWFQCACQNSHSFLPAPQIQCPDTHQRQLFPCEV